MSWIGEVGTWVGNDGSTLIAGLVGAGAALLGGVMASRRADRQRREDKVERAQEVAEQRRREDVAAWRERRLDAYSAWMDQGSRISDAANAMIAACQGEFIANAIGNAEYAALGNEVQDALRQMRLFTVRIRLLTTSQLHEDVYHAWRSYQAAAAELPETRTAPSPQVAASSAMTAAWSMTDDVRRKMETELGLPEDE